MSAIVPRWEWRTFGERIGGTDSSLASLSPQRVVESDEVYLISPEGDASVKIRGGLMDVKRLEQVNSDGLELWRPVLKVAFPLSASDVDSVFAALRAAAPPLERSLYTLDELLNELVRPSPELLAVDVRKKRRRYTIGACMVELTEVRADRHVTRTIAAEERREIVGLQPKRAEVILAGACIVRTVMTKLDQHSLTVSDRGLRHGLLVERFGA